MKQTNPPWLSFLNRTWCDFWYPFFVIARRHQCLNAFNSLCCANPCDSHMTVRPLPDVPFTVTNWPDKDYWLTDVLTSCNFIGTILFPKVCPASWAVVLQKGGANCHMLMIFLSCQANKRPSHINRLQKENNQRLGYIRNLQIMMSHLPKY